MTSYGSPRAAFTAAELRGIRLGLGLTRAAMAARIGIRPGTYDALEAGDRPSLLVENAVRWVASTGGRASEDPCATCEGAGTVGDLPPSRKGAAPRRRICPACAGSGRAEPRDAERVIA